jgi:hypothetical protein
MLKPLDSLKELETRAAETLGAFLDQVPAIKLADIKRKSSGADRGIDFLVRLSVSDRPHALACQMEASGQPRHVRMALLQLRIYIAHFESAATPVPIAPYLSAEAQALCRAQEVGFLDFEGDARLVFDGVFIGGTRG